MLTTIPLDVNGLPRYLYGKNLRLSETSHLSKIINSQNSFIEIIELSSNPLHVLPNFAK